MNQPITQQVTGQTVRVNPDTGILLTSNFSQQSTLTFPAVLDSAKAKLFLPMPDLDSHAGQAIILANIDESLEVDQAAFNEQFRFVKDSQDSVHVTSILFLSLMLVIGLVFFGLLAYYCTSLKKVVIEEENLYATL
jgi:hypothetical protein